MKNLNLVLILSFILLINFNVFGQKQLDVELDGGCIYTGSPTGGNGSKFIELIVDSGTDHDSRSRLLFRHAGNTYGSITSSYNTTLSSAGGLNIRTHSADTNIGFSPNSISRMKIMANTGYVGIGTLEPQTNLSVVGKLRGAFDDTEIEYVELTHGGSNGYINSVGDGNLDFKHDGNTVMFLKDNGSLALKTLDNTLSNGLLFQNSGNNYTWNIFRKDAGSNFAHLVFASGSTANIDNLVERMRITSTGEVGIGTTNPNGYKLAVKGNIGAEEIEVRTNYWADFVFEKDYQLRPLKELEAFIQQYGHLPDIPSEDVATSTPHNLGSMDVKLLQKIEELTLYTIEQQKLIEDLRQEMQLIKKQIQNQQ